MRFLKSYLKYFFKVRIVGFARMLLLVAFSPPPNRNEWEKRLLIVYLQAIGDAVMFTSVLKHYKNSFPDTRIYLLVQEGIGVKPVVNSFVDDVLTLDVRRFTTNPHYGYARIAELKKIGFETVLCHDHSPAEISGKFIAVSLGARSVVGYAGFGLALKQPFDVNMKRGIAYAKKHLDPRFTKIIPSIYENSARKELAHVIFHYRAIYESFTGKKEIDYLTVLPANQNAASRVRALLEKNSVAPRSFTILNVGSSTAWKNWPVDRFAEAASVLRDRNITAVLAGSSRERPLGEQFQKLYNGKCVNLIGETSIEELIELVRESALVLTNDTSTAHIAVALKKPSVCVIGTGLLGLVSLYGYRDINLWVHKDMSCVGDNWQCLAGANLSKPAPCIEAIEVSDVREALDGLLKYTASEKKIPREPFSISYLS